MRTRLRWSFVAALSAIGCGDNPDLPIDAGLGIDAPCVATVSAMPDAIDFGTVGVQQTLNRAVVLTNTGTCPTRPLSHAVTGPGASSYAIASTSCAGQTLAPRGSCAVDVRVAPTQTGSKTASLEVHGADAVRAIPLTAAAVNIDTLFLSGSPYNFPATIVSTTSAPRRFVVQNASGMTTPTPLVVTRLGADPAQFDIIDDTCSGATVPAGQSCHVDVVFKPTSSGMKSASIEVNASSFGIVSGAVSGTAVIAPVVIVSPTMIDFGTINTPPGAGAGQTVMVTNTTLATTGPLAISLAGANASSYVITQDTCTGATLTSASCSFRVETTCTGAGAVASATATITGNPGGTTTVPITGLVTGVACGPRLFGSPSTWNFGTQVILTTSASQTFTFTNFSSQPTFPVPTATIVGTNATQFTITSDTCSGAIVAAGNSCTVAVAFAPIFVGTKNASLVVDGNVAALMGIGGPLAAILEVSPTMYDFGSAPGGSKMFTVTNSGGATTGMLATSIGSANPSTYELRNDSCTGVTLAPTTSCTFEIRTTCNPPFGNTSATATVAASPGGTATANLSAAIVGKNCTSITSVAPTNHPYGDQMIATTSPSQTFTFSNFGGQPTGTVTVTLTGMNSSEFVLSNDSCTGTVLPVGGAPCTVDVAFAPQTAGAKQATLSLTGTPSGTAALTGTGVP